LAHLYQPDPDRGSVHRPEFLHQLNLMTREVEFHRSLLRKMATLREEFSKIQTENKQLRVYLNSRFPRDGNFAASNFSGYPRPSADTAGKSWDSIVMDLI
jgi:cell shape-determining protein MreC